MWRWIIRAVAVLGGVVFFLAAVAQIWSVISKDTVPDVLRKWGLGVAVPSWYSPLLIVVGLVNIVLLLSILGSTRKPEAVKVVTYRLKHPVIPHVGMDIWNALPGISLAMNKRANTLVVTGTAAQQAESKKIVDAVDVEGYKGASPPPELVITPDHPPIEFFDSREMLIRLRGGIHQEARIIAHGWAAWWEGATVDSIETYIDHMDRLLIYHPDCEPLRRLAEITGESLDEYQSDIRRATRIARQHHVEVKWSQEPITNLTMDDRKKPDAFARVEVLIPCPMEKLPHAILSSYIVKRNERKALFQDLVSAYQTMWDKPTNIVPSS